MKKTILIVDDSAMMRKIIGNVLKSSGFDVVEGNDGVDALGKLTGNKVDLIITDVNMPNMDGITFLKEVKKLAAYQLTPIIVLTTESQANKKQEAQDAGAKGWINKPFQPARMLDMVSKLMMQEQELLVMH